MGWQRREQRPIPYGHELRSRVAAVSVELDLEGRGCGDGGHDANVQALPLQLGALCDVQGGGKRPSGGRRKEQPLFCLTPEPSPQMVG